MRVALVEDKAAWDEAFARGGSPSFLQSWEWGEFNQLQGYTVYRFGLYSGSKLEAVALTIKITSRRGTFLFIPHGPVVASYPDFTKDGEFSEKETLHLHDIVSALKTHLAQLAREEKCSLIRIGSVFEDTPQTRRIFKRLGFSKAPIYMHSERVWVLPIEGKTEDELLAGMRKTTRYLIRRAPREGVEIEVREDHKAIDDFWKIYKVTASREKFTPFSKEYITHEFEVFKKTGNAIFLFGSHNGRVLASALIIFTPSTAFYHQGASIHTPAPVTYALQWRAIREAQKRGCRMYNFWGVLQEGRTPRAWEGLTLFKKGFGGQQIDYVPTQDYVMSLTYGFTYMYEKFLAMKRGV